jgi:hypothetical protein
MRGWVPKRPGIGLRKTTIDQGKNVCVRKVPSAGQKIGHDVEDAWEVPYGRVVAMELLVQGLEPEEVGRPTGLGDRLLVLSPTDGVLLQPV